MKRASLVLALLISASGCYHVTIITGLQPGTQTVEKPWAHSWLGGLVPPATLETMQTCTTGVARVETQHSFVNLVAQAITSGIYSPVSIKVTCAGGNEQDEMSRALPMIYRPEEAAKALRRGEAFLVAMR